MVIYRQKETNKPTTEGEKVMIKREYETGIEDIKSIVYETNRQKDITDILDEMIENAEEYGWGYTFADDSFYIEYADGTTYEAGEMTDEGNYKKRNIIKMIYTNANDTVVYGDYKVNEYGIVE